mmetsp:Transcript_1334/g.4961  ORF Transcript_1334/g.4961 Transcript_1334/m.4961 type:complete len:246 (+) Transcript_1334:387-1124(+)
MLSADELAEGEAEALRAVIGRWTQASAGQEEAGDEMDEEEEETKTAEAATAAFAASYKGPVLEKEERARRQVTEQSKPNKTGYKGVYSSHGKFQAQIQDQVTKKTLSLGSFTTAEEAARRWNQEAQRQGRTVLNVLPSDAAPAPADAPAAASPPALAAAPAPAAAPTPAPISSKKRKMADSAAEDQQERGKQPRKGEEARKQGRTKLNSAGAADYAEGEREPDGTAGNQEARDCGSRKRQRARAY